MKAMDILAGDHRQHFLLSDHSVLMYQRFRALSSCHFVFCPIPDLRQACGGSERLECQQIYFIMAPLRAEKSAQHMAAIERL